MRPTPPAPSPPPHRPLTAAARRRRDPQPQRPLHGDDHGNPAVDDLPGLRVPQVGSVVCVWGGGGGGRGGPAFARWGGERRLRLRLGVHPAWCCDSSQNLHSTAWSAAVDCTAPCCGCPPHPPTPPTPPPCRREIAWVVFDEVHYMQDRERGVVSGGSSAEWCSTGGQCVCLWAAVSSVLLWGALLEKPSPVPAPPLPPPPCISAAAGVGGDNHLHAQDKPHGFPEVGLSAGQGGGP